MLLKVGLKGRGETLLVKEFLEGLGASGILVFNRGGDCSIVTRKVSGL